MVDAHGNGLVLLLSTPRSGSSLATVLLQNHSRIFATQEMWFVMSLLDLKTPPKRAYGGRAILERFFNGVLPDDVFAGACRSFALRTYNGLLRGSGGADLVVDKSPRYYGLLEFLDTLFPCSRRIWLVRNPLAVLASYKKLAAFRGEKLDLEALLTGPGFEIRAADLTVGLLRYRRYFSQPGDYAFRLPYEKLVAEPKAQLAAVCRFLGTAYEEGMERYGAGGRSSAKTDLYFSMGVGDPFVADHSAPHEQSVDAWKEVLTKREAELYARLLGAELFAELGYGEELAEAERWMGVRIGAEPDGEALALRARQLAEATGWRWQADYRMRAGLSGGPAAAPSGGAAEAAGADAGLPGGPAEAAPEEKLTAEQAHLRQLQMTVRVLEQRLEASYAEQRRLRSQLGAMKRKAEWLKSAIPFGRRLSRIASAMARGGGDP